ncbi:MAG: UvrD-helicase domain-containing protein [bacterium]
MSSGTEVSDRSMDLERELNPQQKEAVLYRGGPLLVLAGAGSGKTRVLTYRIAHLLHDRGVPPFRLLAITFTNKAAEEMRRRISQLLGTASQGMWIGTFHAICARILRQHIDRLGFARNFVIYDESDQLRAIKACFQKLGISDKRVKPVAVLGMLEKAKNQGLDAPEAVVDSPANAAHLEALFGAYRSYLKEANALDFADLILMARRLLQEQPDLLSQYRERFRAILVDEYQDTNQAQHLLLKTLVPPGGDLCVVGDDDQSIYRWRGADVQNLLRFAEDFPGARILVLEQNYRSTKNILGAAEAVARKNPERHPKVLWTANETGEKLSFFAADSPDEEARLVAEEIRSLVSSGRASYREIGVLFRTNAQSRPFEELFVPLRIPYAVVGFLRFYERAEVKDLLSYMRFLSNPRDSVSLRRILNRPARGIGQTTEKALADFADARGSTLWEAVEAAAAGGLDLPDVARRRIAEFRNLVLRLRECLGTRAFLSSWIEEIIKQTGYRNYLEGLPDGERKSENLEELVRTADVFEESQEEGAFPDVLTAFLERVSLVSEVDRYDSRADCVTLMTLHCAKGLEFETVFLTGMEEGLLPHLRSSLQWEELAEERRLCYVGMTRARRKLYLSRSRVRSIYGERKQTRPSSFLRDIPQDLLEPLDETEAWDESAGQVRFGRTRTRSQDPMLDPAPSKWNLPPIPQASRTAKTSEYRVGDLIEHEDLGKGTVRKVEGSGDKEKITVQFRSAGIRKLMASLSPIRKL